ncbi:hypothetical protein E8E14_002463 [Neopestalotiopsis sp. 37M]|nr:hypothetical protein E8E14_002463 [Neopestalotiopsis sp. 37M]
MPATNISREKGALKTEYDVSIVSAPGFVQLSQMMSITHTHNKHVACTNWESRRVTSEFDSICNDKRWFKTLELFPTHVLQVTFTTPKIQAEGVGSVDLPVKRAPHQSGRQAHHVLRLENVIYVPGLELNILGGDDNLRQHIWEYDESSARHKGQDAAIVDHQRGGQVCFMRKVGFHKLPLVQLSQPPRGPVTAPTRFDERSVYHCIHFVWPEPERIRFEKRQAAVAAVSQKLEPGIDPGIGTGSALSADPGRGDYTTKEKAWLKKHWGNEHKFLQAYGLSIYKEDEREEGRALVRDLVQPDENENEKLASISSKLGEESSWRPPIVGFSGVIIDPRLF